MTEELAKVYDPKSVETEIYRIWQEAGAFNAEPGGDRRAFCIVIPPPNVTDVLHLGHALNNTLQDVVIRFRRMQQLNTLWMPGTDHAGIATQTMVEKRIYAEEHRKRTDFTRQEFVARIHAWKDEYGGRILNQLKLMGCSCDWRRTRFTLDEVCARAVQAVFFKLFSDGLIYRGKRLVNWDPATQTVLADDEVEDVDIDGFFWDLDYPLTEPVVLPGGTGVPPVGPTGVSPVEGPGTGIRQGAYLPHWTREGATYAVNFRLADSLPQGVLDSWRAEREDILKRAQQQGRELTRQEEHDLADLFSQRVDSYLDAGHGACYLRDPKVADCVVEALKHFDGDRYELVGWCVMPNHVHVIFRPLGRHDLSEIMHSWKSFTAKQANRIIEREGEFWQPEYYDHLIRDEEEFVHSLNYLLSNPAKAGLREWRWCGHRAGAAMGSEQQQEHGQDAHGTHGQDARATVITHVTVATTRPETMLGDTAVAMNPRDPRAAVLVGRSVRLPIVGRIIPIIADEHVVLPDANSDDAKARFSTGFLKVTPAHDPDDYAIGQRHGLAVINILAPDGSISDKHGWEDATAPEAQNLLGMDRFEAREAVVEWFRQEGLLSRVRPYTHSVGHSYRSHVPIEPYLSDQWYVAVKKQIPSLPEAGAIEGTDVPANSLAGLALAPVLDGRLKFTPDRYAATYRAWIENLRDWPISRQLWWGHQIPIWSRELELPTDVAPEPVAGHELDARTIAAFDRALGKSFFGEKGKRGYLSGAGKYHLLVEAHPEKEGWVRTYFCPDPDSPKITERLEKAGWQRDPDVLDTWFSSALWPFSTLGWPDETPELKTFYPGDVLCTAREIITLWVSRMVMMGQYCRGDIPFHDVFIHAMIQDGEGRKMSKSLGNGIDPLVVIDSHGADAMRFTVVSMTTQTQDVRMPLKAITLPDGRTVNSSEKFDIGRNFCNKLWNASRFAMMNLTGAPPWQTMHPRRDLADSWILSRLNATIRDVTAAAEVFRFNELADTLYHFMWDDLCDWYLEIAKVRIGAGQAEPKAVLAHCLDVLLRLLHPVTPFITEAIWHKLNEVAPLRGPSDEPAERLLITAQWPYADAASINPSVEQEFALLQDLIRQVRNVRTQHNVPPKRTVDAAIEATGPVAQLIADNMELLKNQAQIGNLTLAASIPQPPANAAAVNAAGAKLYVLDIIDVSAERQRLAKQAETLRKGVTGLQSKLGNENFLAKAPADLVQRERQRLEKLQAELGAVEQAMAGLG
jgi:valyl-tRNA synthetase